MPAYPRIIDATTVNGRNGFGLLNDRNQNGASGGGDNLGASVAAVGDVNGDGIEDFVVGAPNGETEDLDANANVGEVWLIFGAADGFPRDLSLSSLDGTSGVRITSTPSLVGGFVRQGLGAQVAGGHDINNDGYADIVIGASGWGYNSGAGSQGYAFVVYGREEWAPTIDVTALNGSDGFSMARPNDGFFYGTASSVASLGDINGDGYGDLAVNNGHSGGLFVVLGGDEGASHLDLENPGARGFRITGVDAVDPLSVSAAGDINGDGHADLLIASRYAGVMATNGTPRGEAYVVYGHAGGFTDIDLADLDGDDGFSIVPPTPDTGNYSFPGDIAGVGDVNGDGIDDIALADPILNQIFVLYGREEGFGAALDLGLFGPADGMLISGATNGAAEVAAAGDLNGDGIGDFAIGLRAVNAPGAPALAGQLYVVFGSAGGLPATLDLASLNAAQGFRLDGRFGFEALGGSLSAGDVNGDGIDDLIIGNGRTANGATASAGSVQILYGRANPTGALTLAGTDQRDGLWGGDFNDNLSGGDGEDELHGFAGNDELDGGALGDVMIGGAGDDTYYVDYVGINGSYPSDNVVEAAGEGMDTVHVDMTGGPVNAWALGTAEIERVLVASAGTSIDGNDGATEFDFALAGSVFGQGGSDVVHIRAGTGHYAGGAGDDTYYVYVAQAENNGVYEAGGEGTDRVYSHVDYALRRAQPGDLGFVEHLTLLGTAVAGTGNGLDNMITGNGLANVLNGGEGADTLTGLGGDDIYHVDNAGDAAVEATGGGTDLVRSTISWTLGANLERLILETGAANGTGNALDNNLAGNAANNILDGRGGADLTNGGMGDDWHYVDQAGDVVQEAAGQGNDRVFAGASWTLGAGASVETITTTSNAGTAAINLTGNELANTIHGNAGANSLNGGAGADTLVGLQGDDYYYVDNAADRIVEGAGQGNDRLFASASYALAAGASVEVMSTTNNAGTAALNLTGNELANTVYGNAGANSLNGGAGADILVGLQGDDFYHVDEVADRVLESAGQGNDRVFASVSYALGAGASVEMLTTGSNAGTAALNLTGNELANAVYGNAGANILDGKGGADTLAGFGGNDWFYVDDAADRVVEGAAEGTADRIFAGASYAMGAGVHVETLTTASNAGTAAINLAGNELAQAIHGNAGANLLDGKGGNDVLVGNAGSDTFAFTTALGAGNVDRIVDFSSVDDTIRLDDAVFAGIGGPGALNASAFVVGTGAQDAGDRIVYNQTTGQLLFDADGSGAGAAVLFATLTGAPVLGAGDFIIV